MAVVEVSFLTTDQIWERSADATAALSDHRNTILIPLGIFSLPDTHVVSPGSSLLLTLRGRVKGSEQVTHLQCSPHRPQHRIHTRTLPGLKHFWFLQL